jgi:hypothetical protein
MQAQTGQGGQRGYSKSCIHHTHATHLKRITNGLTAFQHSPPPSLGDVGCVALPCVARPLTSPPALTTFAAKLRASRPNQSDFPMRADLVTLVADIKQSLELLRRHL